jgi:hypothetical protein
MARYPLRPETIELISAAQVPVQLPTHRQQQIALETVEQAMVLAYTYDLGDAWYLAWKRAEQLRAEMK